MGLDLANPHDRGATFLASRTVRVSSESFNLPRTEVPVPTALNRFAVRSYDRQIAVCCRLEEYEGLTAANGTVYSAWSDARNLLTEPVNLPSPLSGTTYPKQDGVFQVVNG